MAVAELIILALAAWFGVGAIVAVLFLIFGVSRIDESARGASIIFRPAIFLGCMILWPAIVIRMLSGVKINQASEEEA